MTTLAACYYKERAQKLGIAEVPLALQNNRMQVMPGFLDVSERYDDAAQAIETSFLSVESFVLACVRAVGDPVNELQQPAWQHIPGLRPVRSHAKAGKFVRKRILPILMQADDGMNSFVVMRALARDETIEGPLARACRSGHVRRYADQGHEMRQVYVMTSTYDVDGNPTQGMITVMHGTTHPDKLKKDYLSVQYMGAPLLERELMTPLEALGA